MNPDMLPKIVYKLTVLSLILSLISFVLIYSLSFKPGNDGGIALWLAFMVVYFMVSMPVHVSLLIMMVYHQFKGNGKQLKWVKIYLVVTLLGQLWVAAEYGAFNNVIKDYRESKREQAYPAQVKLERGVKLGGEKGLMKVVSALKEGADTNILIADFNMPFIVLAATRGDVDIIKVLLEAGANPNLRSEPSYSGEANLSAKLPSALDVLALNKGNIATINLLIAKGAETISSTLMIGACAWGDVQQFNLAIALKVEKLLDDTGRNCLHLAAINNNEEFIEKIIKTKSIGLEQLEQLDNNKFNPLDNALSFSNYKVSLLYIKMGGKVNRQHNIKRTMNDSSINTDLVELKLLLSTLNDK